MIPYARADLDATHEENVIKWLGVDDLLAVLRQLPPEKEFPILLDFLVEFSGGLEMARHRMEEMLVEQAAISYKAHSVAVNRIKKRIYEIYVARKETEHGLQGVD